MLKFSENGRVAQCIVDECGMATEPETLAAISLTEHCVLIGDHMQLQPVIMYHSANENGLNKSMFERYADLYGKKDNIVTLQLQYRMVYRYISTMAYIRVGYSYCLSCFSIMLYAKDHQNYSIIEF